MLMAAVMIGAGPHKGSHTAVVIGAAEEPLGELRVRASKTQADELVARGAAAWPRRTWAVEGAGGLGRLLAQQLIAAGERVLDVQPKLGARVRLLDTGNVNKNDPDDARSVAVAALRSPGVREARPDDHAAVLKVWSKRRRDLASSRTQVVCRLHAVLCELVPGGDPKKIIADRAARLLGSITPPDAVAAARRELAAALVEDLRRIDGQLRETRKKPDTAVRASGTSGDRPVRGRPGHRCHHHRRGPRRVPLHEPRPLRRLQRHRAHRGLLRAAQGPPAQQARQPAGQPRHSHGRRHPDTPEAQRRPRLLRQETRRGQDPQGGPAVAEAPDQRCCLHPAPGRRPARHSAGQGPGRAIGERLCSPARPDYTPGTGSSGKPLPGLATTLRHQPRARSLAQPGIPR